jgi:hypothetical protein
MTAARSAPRSDPANNHDFRPSAKSREQGAFRGVVVAEADAAVFKEANEGRPTCEHVVDRRCDRGRGARAWPARGIQSSSAATSGRLLSWRVARRSEADGPLISRSLSKSASIRLTASNAIGEIGAAVLLRRALAAISANSKNFRRAWLQHSASTIGPGARSGR